MGSMIQALAAEAADHLLVEKLASDTQIDTSLVYQLADLAGMSVNTFTKAAYANPAIYVEFLKAASGLAQGVKGSAEELAAIANNFAKQRTMPVIPKAPKTPKPTSSGSSAAPTPSAPSSPSMPSVPDPDRLMPAKMYRRNGGTVGKMDEAAANNELTSTLKDIIRMGKRSTATRSPSTVPPAINPPRLPGEPFTVADGLQEPPMVRELVQWGQAKALITKIQDTYNP